MRTKPGRSERPPISAVKPDRGGVLRSADLGKVPAFPRVRCHTGHLTRGLGFCGPRLGARVALDGLLGVEPLLEQETAGPSLDDVREVMDAEGGVRACRGERLRAYR